MAPCRVQLIVNARDCWSLLCVCVCAALVFPGALTQALHHERRTPCPIAQPQGKRV